MLYVQGLVKNMDVLTGNKWKGERNLKLQSGKIKPSTRVEIASQQSADKMENLLGTIIAYILITPRHLIMSFNLSAREENAAVSVFKLS